MAADLAALEGVTRADNDPGLPRHMNQAVRKAAWAYLTDRNWVDHLLLCLLLVQARTGAESNAEVVSLRELEDLLMTELFGPVPLGMHPSRQSASWLDKISLRTVRQH